MNISPEQVQLALIRLELSNHDRALQLVDDQITEAKHNGYTHKSRLNLLEVEKQSLIEHQKMLSNRCFELAVLMDVEI